MKIICVGRNYVDHARELNHPVPETPVFFLKSDTSLLKKNKPFYYPGFTKELHYEVEIVVRINREGKLISEKSAHMYYDEIAIGFDFTARDLQNHCKKNGLPWSIAKAFDNSAPISGFVALSDYKGIQNINFRLLKNRQLVQKANTSEMIFTVDKLISYISGFITLRTGDLLFTGTPAGVGPVKTGDYLEAFIEDTRLLHCRIK